MNKVLTSLSLILCLALGAATAADPDQTMRFNFQNAEITSVMSFMAKQEGKIVIHDDKVKGKVTVKSPGPVTREQAWEILMAILDLRGFSIIRSEKFIKIIPKDNALQKPVDILFGMDSRSIPAEDRVITQVIPLKNKDASEILNNIRPLISSTGNGFVHQGSNHLVITDVATNIRRLAKLIAYLDESQSPRQKGKTRVYPIRYLKVKDVGPALEKIFANPDTKTSGTKVKMTPLESANSMIVTASEEIHADIAQTIKALDIRRSQVLIEIQIIEVTYSDGRSVSVRMDEYAKTRGLFTQTYSFGEELKGSFASIALQRDRVKAFLEMIATENSINILSRPRILTSDNKKAKILVGQEQPILKSVTDVGQGSGKTVSDYVYKDVGIELNVTPYINVDRDVSMEISFVITSILADVNFPGGVAAPLVGKREASTDVTVMDGHTLVIGGLIKNDKRQDQRKVPWVGDLPVVGNLFKSKSKKTEHTELMVFISPQVITNPEEGARATRKAARQVDARIDPAPHTDTDIDASEEHQERVMKRRKNRSLFRKWRIRK